MNTTDNLVQILTTDVFVVGKLPPWEPKSPYYNDPAWHTGACPQPQFERGSELFYIAVESPIKPEHFFPYSVRYEVKNGVSQGFAEHRAPDFTAVSKKPAWVDWKQIQLKQAATNFAPGLILMESYPRSQTIAFIEAGQKLLEAVAEKK